MESRDHHPVKQGIVNARTVVTQRQGRVLTGARDVINEADRTVTTCTSVLKEARHAAIGGLEKFFVGRSMAIKSK